MLVATTGMIRLLCTYWLCSTCYDEGDVGIFGTKEGTGCKRGTNKNREGGALIELGWGLYYVGGEAMLVLCIAFVCCRKTTLPSPTKYWLSTMGALIKQPRCVCVGVVDCGCGFN